MLQVGSAVRIKADAFKDSHDPIDFDLRGRIGTISCELSDRWEVRVDDEFFILDDTEFDEVEFTEKITPDTPRNREFAALIRSGIETLGQAEVLMVIRFPLSDGGEKYIEELLPSAD